MSHPAHALFSLVLIFSILTDNVQAVIPCYPTSPQPSFAEQALAGHVISVIAYNNRGRIQVFRRISASGPTDSFHRFGPMSSDDYSIPAMLHSYEGHLTESAAELDRLLRSIQAAHQKEESAFLIPIFEQQLISLFRKKVPEEEKAVSLTIAEYVWDALTASSARISATMFLLEISKAIRPRLERLTRGVIKLHPVVLNMHAVHQILEGAALPIELVWIPRDPAHHDRYLRRAMNLMARDVILGIHAGLQEHPGAWREKRDEILLKGVSRGMKAHGTFDVGAFTSGGTPAMQRYDMDDDGRGRHFRNRKAVAFAPEDGGPLPDAPMTPVIRRPIQTPPAALADLIDRWLNTKDPQQRQKAIDGMLGYPDRLALIEAAGAALVGLRPADTFDARIALGEHDFVLKCQISYLAEALANDTFSQLKDLGASLRRSDLEGLQMGRRSDFYRTHYRHDIWAYLNDVIKPGTDAWSHFITLLARKNISMTRPFRNMYQCDALMKILPQMLEECQSRGIPLRVFSLGSSNGSEPITVAILVMLIAQRYSAWWTEGRMRLPPQIIGVEINGDLVNASWKHLAADSPMSIDIKIEDILLAPAIRPDAGVISQAFLANAKKGRTVKDFLTDLYQSYLPKIRETGMVQFEHDSIFNPELMSRVIEADIILINNVIYHLPESLKEKLIPLFRALRPGAMLFADSPMSNGGFFGKHFSDGEFTRASFHGATALIRTARGAGSRAMPSAA